MRHRGTGHQGTFSSHRNTEGFLDPSKGSRFESGDRGRTYPAKAVLIPSTGEIIRGQCCRHSAAGNKSEIPAARACHRGRRTEIVQKGENIGAIAATVWKRLVERLHKLLCCAWQRTCWPVTQCFEIVCSAARGLR